MNSISIPDIREATVRRRLHAIGVRGNLGGWVRLPHGRNLQSWASVIDWARKVARHLDPVQDANLIEVIEGRRIGLPTIDLSLPGDRGQPRHCYTLRLAVYILNPGPSYVRVDGTAQTIN